MIPPMQGKPLQVGPWPAGGTKAGRPGSADQAHHSLPLQPIESVHDVIPIEDGEQALHRSSGIAPARLDVFPKDPPGVFDGA
jgi:hypothetical protein